MVKNTTKALADRYFREQCQRMGLPVPDAPPKKPRHAFGKRVARDADGYVIVDPALAAKDTEEGLAIEHKEVWVRPRSHADVMANLGDLTGPAPRMGLDEIWEAMKGDDK